MWIWWKNKLNEKENEQNEENNEQNIQMEEQIIENANIIPKDDNEEWWLVLPQSSPVTNLTMLFLCFG